MLDKVSGDDPVAGTLPQISYYVYNEQTFAYRLSGEFTAEPSDVSPQGVLEAVTPGLIKNGSLAVFQDGRRCLYLREEGQAHLFDLSNGMEVERQGAKFFPVSAWRLLWRDRDDFVELFRPK